MAGEGGGGGGGGDVWWGLEAQMWSGTLKHMDNVDVLDFCLLFSGGYNIGLALGFVYRFFSSSFPPGKKRDCHPCGRV